MEVNQREISNSAARIVSITFSLAPAHPTCPPLQTQVLQVNEVPQYQMLPGGICRSPDSFFCIIDQDGTKLPCQCSPFILPVLHTLVLLAHVQTYGSLSTTWPTGSWSQIHQHPAPHLHSHRQPPQHIVVYMLEMSLWDRHPLSCHDTRKKAAWACAAPRQRLRGTTVTYSTN